ncbi:MAG: hypothetical protein HRU33_14535 [Rhodobacteraceae bacterium]|nr:hypothetical protein [Paracoccaceae bacterium]
MSFPKKGKFFPKGNGHYGKGGHLKNGCFVEEIASALRRSPGGNRASVKAVANWTGANEKTVKNWFSGKYGPNGEHLIALVQHSDEVLTTFLTMAGREDLMVAVKLIAAEEAIADLLAAVRQLGSDPKG